MFIVGFLGWWYGAGWRERITIIGARLARIFDFFSLDLLAKTWFAPFRQIGTGGQGVGLGDQLRVLGDQLVSRVIGGIVRTIMMIIGAISWLLAAIAGLIEGVMWVTVPLLPVAGVIMFAVGWVPHVGF